MSNTSNPSPRVQEARKMAIELTVAIDRLEELANRAPSTRICVPILEAIDQLSIARDKAKEVT